MRLAHISKLKRSAGALGGVEKFAAHLLRTFPDIKLFASDDAPDASGSDFRIARHLNSSLLADGRVGADTVVIADGFWQAGLEGKVKAIISVSHGTWLGIALANEFSRFGDTSEFLKLARWQEAAYRAADVVVAVSPLAAWELKTFYGLDSVVIVNGVDLDVFYPAETLGTAILHASFAGRKQLSMIEDTAGVLARPIEYLNVKTGREEDEAERWRQGRVAVFPSLYEGAAYSTLEAMACGLIPVAFRTGIFWDMPDWAALVTADHYRETYSRLIERAFRNYKDYRPRKWVEENASMKKFSRAWRKVVKRFR